MTLYYPGPYEVEIVYTVAALQHKQRLNCDVTTAQNIGDPLTSVNLKTRGGTPIIAATAIQAWVDLSKQLYGSSGQFLLANLWKYTANSFEKTFVGTMDLATVGSNAGSNVLASQRTLTYRTQVGGKFRVTYLEGVFSTPQQIVPPTSGIGNTIDVFLRGNACWIIGRDGYYPAASIWLLDGQNEATFRKRYRINS